MGTGTLYVEAIVSLLVLVDPISRGMFFRIMTEHEPERRRTYVRQIMIVVAVLLGGAALVGRLVLRVLGINLGAFGIAGGFVLAVMGFEMLLGGDPSRAQGGHDAHERPEPISARDSIIVPYATPFMAGPGAIAAVITIASKGSGWNPVFAALVAVAVCVAFIPLGHLVIANRVNLSDRGVNLMTKFGGLLVATIGVQLMLNGIKLFFNIHA